MKRINLGVLAHVDAGKTTLVERMLYHCGELRSAGSVDIGDTQTDWLPVERERGISVRSSSVSLEHGGIRANIIDTPGHFDFTGETERAVSALDAAILVVSAIERVQPQTELFWQALRALEIPTLIFVNKVDRAGCDPDAALRAVKAELSGAVFARNAVTLAGGRDCRSAPSQFSEDDLLALCDADAQLAEQYLAGAIALCDASSASIDAALAKLSRAGVAYPLLYGSAAFGVGVPELLDAMVRYLPAEDETPNGPVAGVVYKIEHDAAMGKVAHVRLYSGTLRNRDSVLLEGEAQKVTQIRRISGARQFDTGMLVGGDIGAVYGLSSAKAWDVISGGHEASTLPGVSRASSSGSAASSEAAAASLVSRAAASESAASLEAAAASVVSRASSSGSASSPAFERRLRLRERLAAALTVPLFSVKVTGPEGRERDLLRAAAELTDEDPLLAYEYFPDERELAIRVMGRIQLEILETLLLERYGLAVAFSEPTVIYKETPSSIGIGLEAYTMPKPCWAVVELMVEPLPRGSGYRYESVIKANALPYRYQNHIEVSLPDALKQGLLNWQVDDIKVTLVGGESHHVHTHPLDFFLATPIAAMKALEDAGTTLLEPFARVRLDASEELTGRLLGDIIAMRGEFDSPSISGGSVRIEAKLPVATSTEYPARFASLTSGKGRLRLSFDGYRECPAGQGAIAVRRGVNPLDRMRWILHKRNAIVQ